MRGNALTICLTAALVAVLPPTSIWARTADMQQSCAGCHTMHNSQGNSPMNTTTTGQVGALLNRPCYGCHSGDNNSGNMPKVLHTSDPNYQATGTEAGHNNLAGGDFYWVAAGDDLKGHNVAGVVPTQSSRYPPGGSKLFNSSTPLSCAGENGCHGNYAVTDEIGAMSRTHHSDDTLTTDGSTLQQSYRFLNGIAGLEDSDYELTVSAADHNQYKGIDRTADTDPDSTTISHLCASCHGDFHFGTTSTTGVWDQTGTFGTDPWIRHPVDFDMGGIGGEFANYGSGGTYFVATPLASTNVSAVKSTVTLGSSANDAIIVCISCHRAHGSPYDYHLRWDYQNWPDGGGYNGCGDCHTVKN